MKLAPEKIDDHLKGKWARAYLVSGDEPLLVQEAAAAIRSAARARGYDRVTWHVTPHFDWAHWLQASLNGSLFAPQQLIELRLTAGKLAAAGNEAIVFYLKQADPNNVLLMVSPKLESAAQNSAWCKALDERGVWVVIWPVTVDRLPAWAARRLRQRGFTATPAAAATLCERVEGNLLACAQEIEKLLLLHGPRPIDAQDVEAAVADSARFDVFALVDGVLMGEPARFTRILARLEEEGIEPTLVLWALVRELRQVSAVVTLMASGATFLDACKQAGVWDKRKPVIRKAVERLRPANVESLVRAALNVDRVIKGDRSGNPWDELLKLGFALAGQPLFGEGLAVC